MEEVVFALGLKGQDLTTEDDGEGHVLPQEGASVHGLSQIKGTEI